MPGDPQGDQARRDHAVDPEELRYAPRAPQRFLWLRRLAILVAVGLVLGIAVTVGYRWTQSQYYVAADGESVAIYQGVQADIPGLTLTSVHEATDVTFASLSTLQADKVRSGILADDLDDARQTVSRLGALARVCPEPSSSPRPSPGSSPGGATGSPDGSGPSPDGTTSADPSPSASPSPTLAPPDCVEATP